MSTMTPVCRAVRFSRLVDFDRRSLVLSWVLAFLLALTLVKPAQAGCNAADLWDSVVVSLATTAVCQPVCEDKYRCYAAAILGAALTVVANKEGQDKVNYFCNTVHGNANEVVAQVQEVLNV